jgi:hypothetical protein
LSDLAEVYAGLQRDDRLVSRQRLIDIVRSPQGQANGEAWWLLAQMVDEPAQQADCRRRAQAAGYVPAPGAAPAARIVRPLAAVAPVAPPVAGNAAAAPIAGALAEVDYSALMTFVINKLGDDMDRYDLAQVLIARQGWSFADAESFIEYVSANFSRSIAARHMMLILAISMLGLIVGALLACSGVLTISDFHSDGVAKIRASMRFIAGVAMVGSAIWGLLKGLVALRK